MAKTLDLYEYLDNAAAQAAYVTSADPNIVDQQQTNYSSAGAFGSYVGLQYWHSQGFKLSATLTVTAIELRLKTIVNSPTGNWTIRIETNNGGVPSGALADNNATITSTPPAENSLKKYTFATPFELAGNTLFHIVISCAAQEEDDRWNLARAGNLYPDGLSCLTSNGGSSWTPDISVDLYFKVYVQGYVLQCYSENSIKQQGSYSLKVIAAQTGSLNETLTRTVGPTIDLSGYETLTIWVYASRTGTNIEVKIHDSGGTTTTISIAIASASEWTEIELDISAVADADKDDIDSIIIKIINADGANTFYVDNFFGTLIPAYPVSRLNKNRLMGYHCFMDQYMRATREGLKPLKLPDGTVF